MMVYYINSVIKNLADFQIWNLTVSKVFNFHFSILLNFPISLSLIACDKSYREESNRCMTDKWSLLHLHFVN